MEVGNLRIWLSLTLAFGLIIIQCTREPKPNVVVITIDTLRADHLSCYGYAKPTSPRIDALAAESVLFEKALCQAPQTLPSHTSIFTGMHPRHHRSITHESPVEEGVQTLAELLKARGYRTGAFISSHALDSKYNLTQGFDTYWEIHKEYNVAERKAAVRNGIDLTTEAVLAWLKGHKDDRFFLWVHWFHPHRPYNPPPIYKDRFAGTYDGDANSEPEFIINVWRNRIELSQADVSYLRGCYDGEVAFTDRQVGRLLDELTALGLKAKTIIVLTSDHGEILYEHEYYFGHDIGLYDECLWVPLLFYGPGLLIDHRRVSQPVETIDIMPTLLDLLEISKPKEIEGKSLLPLIAGAKFEPVTYFFSETFPFPEKSLPRHAVRTAQAKLVWKETSSGDIIKEFYDLSKDPGETRNLYDITNPLAAHLDSVMTSWIAPQGLHPARIPSARESGRWRILKSLGYIN